MLALALALVQAAWARPASIGFADAEAHPIRCHWERAEDEARCVTVLQYATTAWDVQVDRMGFTAPLPDGELGGSDALDIYLGVSETSGAGEAWVDCDGGDGHCDDADPTDGRAAAPAYVVIDARTRDDVLPAYVVHEFDHTLQYATDWAEPFLSVWEGTAVAAEMWTLPDVDPSADDIADYQAVPWLSAVLQDGYFLADEYGIPDSWYEYGAMVWVRWIDARYGDGEGSVAPRLWEAMTQEGSGTEPDVLDAWEALAGVPWQDEMLAFAADRARMGGDEGPEWLAFAGEQGRVARTAELSADGELTPSTPLYPLGAAYVDLEMRAGDVLSFTFDGDASTDWGTVVVEPGGATEIFYGDSGTISLGPTRIVTIGVVNLGPLGMDADDPLAAATFALHVSMRQPPTDSGNGGPLDDSACACGTPTPPVAAWLVGALACVTGRRRQPGPPARRQPPNTASNPKRTPTSAVT